MINDFPNRGFPYCGLPRALSKDDKTQAEILLVQAIATLCTQPACSSDTPEDVYARIWGYAFPAPVTLFFFDNGSTMAGDAHGRQMPRYQGPHREALDRLAEDGIPLAAIEMVHGSPENPVK